MQIVVTAVGPDNVRLADPIIHYLTGQGANIAEIQMYDHDEEALFHLATSKCGFVGMIGSKRKVKLILDDLEEKGIPRTMLDRVRAPLGFNIGSQTVPEIAVSIVSELIAVRNLGRAAVGLPP